MQYKGEYTKEISFPLGGIGTAVLGFAPRGTERPFRSVWACGGAWGRVELTETSMVVTVVEGTLSLARLDVETKGTARSVTVDGTPCVFRDTADGVELDGVQRVTGELRINLN